MRISFQKSTQFDFVMIERQYLVARIFGRSHLQVLKNLLNGSKFHEIFRSSIFLSTFEVLPENILEIKSVICFTNFYISPFLAFLLEKQNVLRTGRSFKKFVFWQTNSLKLQTLPPPPKIVSQLVLGLRAGVSFMEQIFSGQLP